jgi:outer membrane murein-binding lipoprotein Lpp
MKILTQVAAIGAIAVLAGCASPAKVAQMEGRGERQVLNAPYEPVWRAAVDAAQISGLEIQSADAASGYIATRRGIRPGTTGENVGIWVTRIGPDQTQVEVVSRSAGPPRPLTRNWERRILNAMEANLTREMTGRPIMTDPAGADVDAEPVPPTPVRPLDAPPPL